MFKKIAASTVLGSICALAHGAPFDGAWKVSVSPKEGEPFAADMVLDGDGGHWQSRVRNSREAPCLGRRLPVHVLAATQDGMSFHVAGSESLAGCPDFTVKLQRVDDRTLTGTRGSAAVVLERQ